MLSPLKNSDYLRVVGGHVLAIFAFWLILLLTGPAVIRHPISVLADRGDTLIALGILQWIEHCLTNWGATLANFPIFYPVQGALFFTEHMLGIGVLFSVVDFVVGNKIFAYNLVLLIFFTLNFYAMFLLMLRMGVRNFGAFLSGTAFGALPFLLNYTPHIHLAPAFFFPLSFLVLYRFITERRPSLIVGLSACICGQFYFGMTLGLTLLACIVTFLVWLWVFNRSALKAALMEKPRATVLLVLASFFLAFLLLAPLGLEYGEVESTYNFKRLVTDPIPFSTEPLALLAHVVSLKTEQFLFNTTKIPQNYSQMALMGALPFYVGLLAIVYRVWLRRIVSEIPWFTAMLFMLFLMLTLIWGPFLLVNGHRTNIPLPYYFYFRFFPGFDSMRVPVRFIIQVDFFAAILFGMTWRASMNALRSHLVVDRGVGVIGLGIVLAAFISDRLIDYSPGVPATEFSATPVVYKQINDGSERPVLEIPVWPPSPPTFSYFYYQSMDWRPRLGGISSFFPPSFMRLRDNLAACPSEACLAFIGTTKAQTIIVHLSALNTEVADKWRAHERDFGAFHFVGLYGEALLWERATATSDSKLGN